MAVTPFITATHFTADIAARIFNDDVTFKIYITDGGYPIDLDVKVMNVN